MYHHGFDSPSPCAARLARQAAARFAYAILACASSRHSRLISLHSKGISLSTRTITPAGSGVSGRQIDRYRARIAAVSTVDNSHQWSPSTPDGCVPLGLLGLLGLLVLLGF